jgi:hypothetical protein
MLSVDLGHKVITLSVFHCISIINIQSQAALSPLPWRGELSRFGKLIILLRRLKLLPRCRPHVAGNSAIEATTSFLFKF